jgi:zinc D-Ala-D-Ala carboxypeptidase
MQPDADLQLSPHFKLSEFLLSQEAVRHSIANVPTPEAIANLRRTAFILEMVRVLLGGVPINISSGFRSTVLNAYVNGEHDSAHLDGRAADFTSPAFGTPQQICQRLIDHDLAFDQLIFEGGWVHIGVAVDGVKPRREVLTAIFSPGQRTRYVPGVLH